MNLEKLNMMGKRINEEPEKLVKIGVIKYENRNMKVFDTNILTLCWIMNRLIHDLALFILFRIKSEDKANKVLPFLDT